MKPAVVPSPKLVRIPPTCRMCRKNKPLGSKGRSAVPAEDYVVSVVVCESCWKVIGKFYGVLNHIDLVQSRP